MSRDSEQRSPGRLRVPGAAYLLSQVGALSSQRWHERLAPIGLDPRSALVLRNVAAEEGRTQASLADQLGLPASRIVGVVDELERRGLLQRRAHRTDRRANALRLTGKGREVLDQIMAISRQHEAEICAGLSESRRRALIDTLSRIVSEQGLAVGGHPRMSEPPEGRTGRRAPQGRAS